MASTDAELLFATDSSSHGASFGVLRRLAGISVALPIRGEPIAGSPVLSSGARGRGRSAGRLVRTRRGMSGFLAGGVLCRAIGFA
jgi:hypothetical protein